MAQYENLRAANEELESLSAEERIKWATSIFPDGLYALTSGGIDSGVMIDQLSQAPMNIPVLHINTGFVPAETIAYRNLLREYYEFDLREIGPDQKAIEAIKTLRLWEIDLELYSVATKIQPLKNAVKQLGAKALLNGVRRDQTEDRAGLEFIGMGLNGEYRIHPLLDWTDKDVEDYKARRQLRLHPLQSSGYGSVDDVNLMQPGTGRSGRIRNECGIHTTDGKIRRREVTRDQ